MLTVTGFAWWSTNLVIGGFNVSAALADPKFAKSVGGATNILIMGLDTRKDQDGNQLPDDVLAQLHAGDGNEGGYNTNTLILVHVPADGKNIKAFSIPRDDYVRVHDITGYTHAKIKEAYGLKKAEVEDELVAQGMTDRKEIETQSREAARKESLATVEGLVGVPIDHFVEVSLVGFYDLAKQLGGVEVCLKHPVRDGYSGARFRAGLQHLNASQALAFVRQRHGLTNGDLDRTHRQQAFIASVALSLQKQGVFTNIDQLTNMISIAQKDIVISSGWDVTSFAQQVGDIAGTDLTFTTLPVKAYGVVDEQDINIIDPATIRAEVQKAFGQSIPDDGSEDDDGDDSSVSEVAATSTLDQKAPESTTKSPEAAATTADSGDSSDGSDGSVTSDDSDGPAPDSGTIVRGGQIPCVD